MPWGGGGDGKYSICMQISRGSKLRDVQVILNTACNLEAVQG
jgi:hypothetical protein